MNVSLVRWTALAGLTIALSLSAGIAHAQQQQPRAPAQPQRPTAPAQQQPAAKAQPLPPKGTQIVVVDAGGVERSATAFQAIRTQHERQRQGLQTEAAKIESELKNAEQELARQRTILSPEAFTQRRRDFEKRVNDAQQSINSRRRDLDEAANAAHQRVIRVLIEVVGEVVNENDYQIVMSSAQTFLFRPQLDITGEVVQRLNKKMPTMTVQVAPAK